MRADAWLYRSVVPLTAAALVTLACAPVGRSPTPTRDTTLAVRVTPAPELDGEAISSSLLASGLPVTDMRVYDAQSDPDKLLGRPNQYSARVAWRDRRVGADATIEVFPTAASFQARKALIEARNSQDGSVVEYLYERTERRVLLRLPRVLAPEQAAQYEQWLSTI